MSIFVIGFNHKTAPVAIREQVYYALEKVGLYLQDLINRGIATEAVLISTCNRSELYCEAIEMEAVKHWFCTATLAQPLSAEMQQALQDALYIYQGEQAVAHMMRVACGLDSMVLGEPQILGQLKEAFSESCAVGAVSTLFHRLFQQVFAMAKEIRTTTSVGACPVSVASSAVHFVKQQIENFNQAHIALLGAGDTTELLMRYLSSQVQSPLMLVNRSIEKADDLAKRFNAQAYDLDNLAPVLERADVVFTATGSPLPIVTQALVKQAMALRPTRRLIFVDIAVPRDIEASVGELSNVSLYCIDDLKVIIEQNRQGREHAANKANELIQTKSKHFIHELASHEKITHTIRAYRRQIEDICRAELLKAKQQLYFGAEAAQVLDAFAHAFTKKLLHTPSVQLRQAGVDERNELLRVAKQLFAITDSDIERL